MTKIEAHTIQHTNTDEQRPTTKKSHPFTQSHGDNRRTQTPKYKDTEADTEEDKDRLEPKLCNQDEGKQATDDGRFFLTCI